MQKIKAVLKQLAIGLLTIFILSNIISWIKKPALDSTHLPKGTVRLVDGTHYTFQTGKPLIIHFWASWCRVCKMEASNIERLSKRYEVLSIAVNSGSDEAVKTYMKEHGLHFHVLNDVDGSWARRFKVEVFPTTFIYDTKGELCFTEVGYTTTAGLLARVKMVE